MARRTTKACPEKERKTLKVDWEVHDGYQDDPEGRECNLNRRKRKRSIAGPVSGSISVIFSNCNRR